MHFLRQSFTNNYYLTGSWYIIQIHTHTRSFGTWFLYLSVPRLLAGVVPGLEWSLTLLHVCVQSIMREFYITAVFKDLFLMPQ